MTRSRVVHRGYLCTNKWLLVIGLLDYFLILVLRLRAYIIANGLDVKWDWSELKKKKDNLARRHLTSLVI